jgi:hypothetical protein
VTGDVRVRLRHHELVVVRSALKLRESSWRVERSRAEARGDAVHVAACDGVLALLGELVAKLDAAADRAGEPPLELVS